MQIAHVPGWLILRVSLTLGACPSPAPDDVITRRGTARPWPTKGSSAPSGTPAVKNPTVLTRTLKRAAVSPETDRREVGRPARPAAGRLVRNIGPSLIDHDAAHQVLLIESGHVETDDKVSMLACARSGVQAHPDS